MKKYLQQAAVIGGLALSACADDETALQPETKQPSTDQFAPDKANKLFNCFFQDDSADQYFYPATDQVKEQIKCVLDNPDSLVETVGIKSTGVISIDQFVCVKGSDLLKSPCYQENPYSSPQDFTDGMHSYLWRHRQQLSEDQIKTFKQAQQGSGFYNDQTDEICGLDYRYGWATLSPDQNFVQFVPYTFNISEQNFLKEKCPSN